MANKQKSELQILTEERVFKVQKFEIPDNEPKKKLQLDTAEETE